MARIETSSQRRSCSLFQLFDAGLDHHTADRAARNADGSAIRGEPPHIARGNTAHQRSQYVAAQAAILAQQLVSGNLHFGFGFVIQDRKQYLAVGLAELLNY
jgi:hypothetical protein